MKFIQSLNESKLFSSSHSFSRYTGRQLAEMCYLHIIALRIISCEKITLMQSKQYALKTNNHDKFKKWHQNSTDVYLLLYALLADDVKTHDTISRHFIDTLNIDVPKITAWLLSISSHNDMSETRSHRLFATLDNQLKVHDGSFRSIRRLAMNWTDLTLREKQLCFTRLIQIMRQRCHSSDLFFHLERLAKNNGLELLDVCDLETGYGCGTPTDDAPTTSLARAAQLHRSVYEDDGGAAPAIATTSADIAPLVKPLGKVRRRTAK